MIGSKEIAKRRRIGGSDLPKLLGISKYGNARDVFDRVFLGIEEPAGPAANRGKLFEPVVRREAQKHLVVTLEPHTGEGENKDYYLHPEFEFAHAQVDDLAQWNGASVVCDYKTVNRWAARHQTWGKPGTDEVPESMRAQIAWEMLCADRDLSILVVAFGEDVKDERVFDITQIATYEIQRCPQYEGYLVGVASEFWARHIVPGVPPNEKPIGKNKVPIT